MIYTITFILVYLYLLFILNKIRPAKISKYIILKIIVDRMWIIGFKKHPADVIKKKIFSGLRDY